jgi:hypothetical protein
VTDLLVEPMALLDDKAAVDALRQAGPSAEQHGHQHEHRRLADLKVQAVSVDYLLNVLLSIDINVTYFTVQLVD